MENPQRVTFLIEKELKERLDEVLTENYQSLSGTIRGLILEYIKKKEAEKAKPVD